MRARPRLGEQMLRRLGVRDDGAQLVRGPAVKNASAFLTGPGTDIDEGRGGAPTKIAVGEGVGRSLRRANPQGGNDEREPSEMEMEGGHGLAQRIRSAPTSCFNCGKY